MRYLCILPALFLICCGKPAVEKPSNLIPEDQMIDILYDLSLLDAMKSQSPDKLQQAKGANDYIYTKYKIDSLQFANSNKYYASDLKEFRKLYEEVNKRLESELKKNEQTGEAKPEKREKLPEGGVVK